MPTILERGTDPRTLSGTVTCIRCRTKYSFTAAEARYELRGPPHGNGGPSYYCGCPMCGHENRLFAMYMKTDG